MKTFVPIFIGLTILFAACENTSPITEAGTTGSINFNSYVAFGNSLTAGFQSKALYASSQMYSYPALMAQQAQKAGASLAFAQPLIKDPGVGGRLRLTRLFPIPSFVTDVSLTATDPAIYVNAGLPQNSYANLGIPGARVVNLYNQKNDVLDTLNSYTKSFLWPVAYQNPFHHIVRRNPGGGLAGNPGSAFQQGKKLNPTLISVWLGNNDVLGYASSGGTDPLSGNSVFQASFNAMMDSLKSIGAKIVVANIPDVTTIAFFTTIKWFVPDPNDVSKPFGGTPIPLKAVKGDGSVAFLGPNDLVLLTAVDSLGSGYGLPSFTGLPHSGEPLGNQFVLDSAEVVLAKNATTYYNNSVILPAIAGNPNIALVDVNSVLNDLAAHGLTISGQFFSTAYISGGVFSLDGFHPTSQTQGILANLFIRAMNEKWGALIPYVNILDLPGIAIPLSKRSTLKLRLTDIPGGEIQRAVKVLQ